MGKFKKILGYTLLFGLGGLLMYHAFKNVNLNELGDYFSRVKLFPLFASLLLGALAYAFRGLRCNLIFKSMGYTPFKFSAMHTVAFGYFMNILMPRAGEVFRAVAFSKIEKVPVQKVMGTILAERIIDLFFLSLSIGLSFVINYDSFRSLVEEYLNINLSTLLVVILGMSVAMVLFLVLRKKIKNHLKVKGSKPVAMVLEFVSGIERGIVSVGNVENKISFWGYTLLIWIMYYLMVFVVFYSFDALATFGFSEGLFLFMIGAIGMVMPTPGGIGSYHFAIMIGFYLLGQSKELGLAFATIVHAVHTTLALVWGGGAFFMLMHYKKKRKKITLTS